MKKTILAIVCAASALGAFAANTVLTFSTQGTETYRDGTAPLDGECYALAWTDDAANFAINSDGTATGGKLVLTKACAESGRCYPVTLRMSEATAAAYSGGTWGVYLLDTRTTDEDGTTAPSGATGNQANLVNDAILVPDATIEIANETFMSRTTLSSAKFLLGAGTVATADDLATAVATGGTVTLGADITLTDELVVTCDVTLNLGTYTLTAASGENAIRVNAGGSLTINADETSPGGITADSGNYALWADYEVSEGVKTITVNGGVFNGDVQFNKYPIYTEAVQSGEAATPTTVTIAGGVFEGHFGLYHAPTTISGGTFKKGLDTSSSSVMVYSNTRCPVVITGGSFATMPVTVGTRVTVGSTYYSSGYYIVGDTANCEAVRNGIYYLSATEALATVGADTTITFLKDDLNLSSVSVTIGEGQSLTIPSGSFSNIAAASGLTLQTEADTSAGTVTYTAYAEGMVAKIGSTYYATLAAAFAAASDSSRIVLITDCGITDDLTLTKSVELALNEKTLTISADTIDLTGGTLTISGAGLVQVSSAGLSATADNLVITGGTYSFDPTDYVPYVVTAQENEPDDDDWRSDKYCVFEGYAFDASGNWGTASGVWTVVPVPKAYVTAYGEEVTLGANTLDAAYSFNAFCTTNGDSTIAAKFINAGFDFSVLSDPVELARAKEVLVSMSPFLNWDADFVVSVDCAVPAGSLELAGQYDTYGLGWVSFTSPAKAEGAKTRLLVGAGSAAVQDWTYYNVCTKVGTFNCGTRMVDSTSLAGATMKVQLRIYDPDQDEGLGSPSILICEYKYTFGGYAAKNDDGTLRSTLDTAIANVASNGVITVMNDFTNSVTIASCGKPFTVDENGFNWSGSVTPESGWAFDKMSNGSWYYYPKTENTYTVEVVSDDGETIKLSTVTPDSDWIDDNVSEDESVEEVLAQTDDNGLAKWQNYVLGQDATAAVRVDDEQGEISAMPVSNTLAEKVNVPEGSGFTVTYELDTVSADGEVLAEGTAQEDASTGFTLDLTDVKTNAYFRLAAVLEATDGTGARTKVNSENTIGVLVVTNAPALSLIAVPWKSLNDGEEITVSNLVRTATLTAGDKLYAYGDGGFRAWELEDGAWKAVASAGSAAQSASADSIQLSRGSAVWLERQDATKPIYLVGEVATTTASTTLETPSVAETDGSQSWNLVASPSVEPVDVVEMLRECGDAKDRVIVPMGADAAPRNFRYNTKKSAWGYDSTEVVYDTDGTTPLGVRAVFKTDDATVPAGTGFWYLNSSDEEDKTINW